MMRYLVMVCLIVLAGGAGRAQNAAKAGDYLGVWAGSWDGPSNGEFDLTLDKNADGTLHGRIAVTAGSPPYASELKSVTLDGASFTGKYDYPLDDGGEVTLQATFDGRTGKGVWVLRPQGQEGEVARGTLALSRK